MTTPESSQPEQLEETGRTAPVTASFLDELITQAAEYFPGDDFVIED